jgi:uncharacterized protein (DUF697 family)
MLRKPAARRIIEKHVAFAIGAGLVPIPLVDFWALVAVIIKMVKDLAEEYGIEVDQRRIRDLILPLLKSPGLSSLAIAGLGSFLKALPFVGMAGAGATTILVGALTYATGRVFALHFEKGGNLHDFDLRSQRKIFLKEYHLGKKTIHDIRSSASKKNAEATHEDKEFPIYLILKPNLGTHGKVYLKTYYAGKRPEKYIGTMRSMEERYQTKDLQLKENQILRDYKEEFVQYVRSKFENPKAPNSSPDSGSRNQSA